MSEKHTIFNSRITMISIVVGIAGIAASIWGFEYGVPSISIGGMKVTHIATGGTNSSVISVVSSNTATSVSSISGGGNIVIHQGGNTQPDISVYGDRDTYNVFEPSSVGPNDLYISGVGNAVEIRQGNRHTNFRGTTITGVGQDQILYLEPRKNINVYISGSGHDRLVDRRVLPLLTISDTGTGTDITEF